MVHGARPGMKNRTGSVLPATVSLARMSPQFCWEAEKCLSLAEHRVLLGRPTVNLGVEG